MILEQNVQKKYRTISFYAYFMRKYAPFGGRANIPGWICAR